MKRFLKPGFFKDNIALVAGISLPLLLMAFFFIAGRAAVVTVDPPLYDAVFAANYNENWSNQPWRIRVEDGRLAIHHKKPTDGSTPHHYNKPQIYVLDHETLYARKLNIDFENIVEGEVKDPELDRLNKKNLLTDPLSPDGYRLEYHYRSSGGGVAGEFFGFGRYRNRYALVKEPRAITIKGPQRLYQAHFIGWIEEDK